MKKKILLSKILTLFIVTTIFQCQALKKATQIINKPVKASQRLSYSHILQRKEYLDFINKFSGMTLKEVPANIVRQPPLKQFQQKHSALAKKSISKNGTLVIEEGWKFSESERRAAQHMCDLGYDIVLRKPRGKRRQDGDTSDLLVDGKTCDVYTPISEKTSSIIEGIAAKHNQARLIILDLSQTPVKPEDLGNVILELAKKKIFTIEAVIILNKSSNLICWTNPRCDLEFVQ